MHRRKFLTSAIAAACAIAVAPAFSAIVSSGFIPTSRKRGTTVRNVKDYGAKGDGSTDDTKAIQAAINSLPSTGGTVAIPAGTYMIDTVTTMGIRLRSNMLLQMADGATLKAKTSSVKRAYVLYINNISEVEIAGGQIIGDRATHKYASGSTDEWNHGIQIANGDRLTIRDIRIAECTGDGICVGGGSDDVMFVNIISTHNRRQGLSLTLCSNIAVYDSEFSYTQGTAPEFGIDIEPLGTYTCKNVHIENCWLHHNAKDGVHCVSNVSQVTVTKCLIEYNGRNGMVVNGKTGTNNIHYTNNVVQQNYAPGIALYYGDYIYISGNTFYNNRTKGAALDRSPDFSYTGWKSAISRDIQQPSNTQHLSIGSNLYK
ncbi:right-handed parallel beta-helix repeat-containing protein [Cognatiluteimonas profundi]|uniref:right-handed parallel beta-helix repeat-containing protein n=1 Tax=Cognatiluteimonas profundi TaxID=2594501 RepID=UPI00131C105A|nr:right-handed parallel beta-helix repeat-containing protein [Lysobacter profundi]